MTDLRKKLQKELDRQRSKEAPKHRVPGYRQNTNARVLLEAQKDRQQKAIAWREHVLSLPGELTMRRMHWYLRDMSRNWNVYYYNGVPRVMVDVRRGEWRDLEEGERPEDWNGCGYVSWE